jgi:hypothetical protein
MGACHATNGKESSTDIYIAMSTILTWMVAAIMLGALCLALAFTAIAKRRMAYLYGSFGVLGLAILCAAMAFYLTAERTVAELRAYATPRSGADIYAALFGPPINKCKQVLDHDDALIPKLDNVIRLHVRTCPEELRRIVAQGRYTEESSMKLSYTAENEAYSIHQLGEDATTLNWTVSDGRHWRTLHFRPDSTELIVIDILD